MQHSSLASASRHRLENCCAAFTVASCLAAIHHNCVDNILVLYLAPTKDDVYAIARDVCLSVCLSVRIWMKFCVSTDVRTWTN